MTELKTPQTVGEVVEVIGKETVMQICGVGADSVRIAITKNEMPALWAVPIKSHEEKAGGFVVKMSLFKGKPTTTGHRPRHPTA